MEIVVHNSPATGALLSDNNNQSILYYYDEVSQSKGNRKKFIDFRKQICAKYGTSAGNDRTIYPFLKNLGFIRYDQFINYDSFFTDLGMKYVNVLQAIQKVEESENISGFQKENTVKKLNIMLQRIVYRGLWIMMTETGANVVSYHNTLLRTIQYLLDFKSIDKAEFAYMLYFYEKGNISLKEFSENIARYRNDEITIDIIVDVHDKTEGNVQKRAKKKGSFTCYGYLIGLLEKAGIVSVNKNKKRRYDRYELNSELIPDLFDLLKQAGE